MIKTSPIVKIVDVAIALARNAAASCRVNMLRTTFVVAVV